MTKERFDELPAEEFNLDFGFNDSELNKVLARAGMELDTIKEEALYELGCGELLNNGFIVNNAGILFFALHPQRVIPQSYITCVRYKGNSMASVIDRKDLEGGLFSLVEGAEGFVKRHTRLAYLFDGFKRINIEEYPYVAVREAVINAVCHRDYFLKNNIFVNVFDDRIEIISPGNIPNDLSLKEIYGKSNPRNFKIVDIFKKAHYVEKLGSGLKRMEELMMVHGLKKPEYEASKAFFKVTFLGPKDKIHELVRPSKETDLRDLGLNERQIKILNYLQGHKKISIIELSKKLGTTERTARRDLNELTEKGLVLKTGRTKDTKYSLP